MKTIERSKLFELVWDAPLREVAPRLGMSGRGLAKLCIRENIPLPPLGYFWEPLPQNKSGRFNPHVEQSACTPFHEKIVALLDAGETVKQIREALQPLGFSGSFDAVRRYARKLMRGRVRTVKSKNRYGEFAYQRRGPVPSYMAERPPLPPGEPVIVLHGHGEAAPELVTETKPASLEFDEHPGDLLAMLQVELDYARRHDPEQFLAFWFEVGTDLPAEVLGALKWEEVRDDGTGWELATRKGKRARVAPRAVEAMRGLRERSGPVLSNPHFARRRLSWLLGPDWRAHVDALREMLR